MATEALNQFEAECYKFVLARKRKRTKGYKQIIPAYWAKLGSGHYSEVWAHCDYPDVVLKISGTAGWGNPLDTPWGSDLQDPWRFFAEVCNTTPDIEVEDVLPVVHRLHQVSNGIYWGILDRLKPLDSDNRNDWDDMLRLERIVKTSPDVIEAFNTAADALGGGVGWDLHFGNFMRDPRTGSVVVTDPFLNL